MDTADLLLTTTKKAYVTFDPDHVGAGITLSDGDLLASYNTAAWRSLYIQTPQTTGLWAIEFIPQQLLGFNPALKSILPGLADNYTTTTYIGGFANSIGNLAIIGRKYNNNNSADGYWYAVGTIAAGSPKLMVIDLTNRKIGFKTSGNDLLFSEAVVGVNPLVAGLGLYTDTVGLVSIYLNSGQQAFDAPNAAAISAYEIANGVNINRGLWF